MFNTLREWLLSNIVFKHPVALIYTSCALYTCVPPSLQPSAVCLNLLKLVHSVVCAALSVVCEMFPIKIHKRIKDKVVPVLN
jgi:hypothetical protein